MSELISGKEALIALANGDDVQHISAGMIDSGYWSDSEKTKNFTIHDFYSGCWVFRLKPNTITINGVKVPAPFEPKEGEDCCYLSDESVDGFHTISYNSARYAGMAFGLYRPSEVEKVVAALRSVFNVK